MSAAVAGASAQAGVIRAIQASGVIVRVEPAEFQRLLDQMEEPLVVHALGGFFQPRHRYLTSFRGLAFFTFHADPLVLPGGCLVVEAQRIWIPC